MLVVDDNTAFRESLQLLLESHGLPANGVANGKEALDYLRAHDRPDLILLDLDMPVMDGLTFLGHLKQSPALGSIPVVVLSVDSDLPEKVASIGVAGHLKKPFRAEELLDAIKALHGRE